MPKRSLDKINATIERENATEQHYLCQKE